MIFCQVGQDHSVSGKMKYFLLGGLCSLATLRSRNLDQIRTIHVAS